MFYLAPHLEIKKSNTFGLGCGPLSAGSAPRYTTTRRSISTSVVRTTAHITMKVVLMLLVLLPLAFSKPLEKRMLLSNILDSNEVKHIVSLLVQTLGSDTTEKLCETECPLIIKVSFLQNACPMVCPSIQTLIQKFNLE
ncbi:uncharacterized protein LOC124287995 [Haliotis rubra]|uniref:uncharacterized protein LOC124287995 n=1 Tax=Haliotis rubra TaxID=36100 RepID=UPI001EE60242|nr:uncharacterized protein LOC124287995 [Haliotis rubra]